MKVNLTFAKRSGVPRLVGLRQRGQQRLRLGDLRHFWGRRKALERGCKHGVRVGVAARRTIELRERERGAQLEAARLLGLRDGDGGEERLFGGGGVCGVVFEQDIAACAMQLRPERAIAGALDRRHRFVED